MRKTILLTAAGVLAMTALPAAAIERINTPSKSCAAIQNTLVRDGAAILRYPGRFNTSITLYDRYVADSRFCQSDEIGEWASVPSRDGPCRVIACERWEPEDNLFGIQRVRPVIRLRLKLN